MGRQPDKVASDRKSRIPTLAFPGEFPYTRGIHRDMYAAAVDDAPVLWFCDPEETNARYLYLLSRGRRDSRSRLIYRRYGV